MSDPLALLGFGLATVLDTVLLVAVIERREVAHLRGAIPTAVTGVWVWHASSLIELLIRDAEQMWGASLLGPLAVVQILGAALFTGGLIHGAHRAWRHGLVVVNPWDFRYSVVYAVTILIVALVGFREPWTLERQDVRWTVVAFGAVNIVCAVFFASMARRPELPSRVRAFGFWMSLSLLIGGVFVAIVGGWLAVRFPDRREGWEFLLTMLPVCPALLLAIFVIRFQFLGIVIKRTVVYSAFVVGVFFVAHVLFRQWAEPIERRIGLDPGILVGLVVIFGIWGYRPLRQRTAEALRYLLGERVEAIRDGTRTLAVEMSVRAGDSPKALLDWFAEALREVLDAAYVVVSCTRGQETIEASSGGHPRIEGQALDGIARELEKEGLGYASCYGRRNREWAGTLRSWEAFALLRFGHGPFNGVLLLGRRRGNLELSHEEQNALSLLAQQLGITMSHFALQADRLVAERRALQNEKLSTLGLLSSSIAHEIKNPLSSIKTIATVLKEDLGPSHPRAEDVDIILSEIERLSEKTKGWLSFVRPADETPICHIRTALGGTLDVMSHAARSGGHTLRAEWGEGLGTVRASENAVREIFYNLLVNALDAQESPGTISVSVQKNGGMVRARVRDSGRGLPREVQNRLFDPFVTTKKNGTGLGLYVAARRAEEVGGTLRWESEEGQGTTFTVELPGGPS